MSPGPAVGRAEGGDRLGREHLGLLARRPLRVGSWGVTQWDTGFNRIPWLLWSQGQVQGDRWEVENSRTRRAVVHRVLGWVPAHRYFPLTALGGRCWYQPPVQVRELWQRERGQLACGRSRSSEWRRRNGTRAV